MAEKLTKMFGLDLLRKDQDLALLEDLKPHLNDEQFAFLEKVLKEKLTEQSKVSTYCSFCSKVTVHSAFLVPWHRNTPENLEHVTDTSVNKNDWHIMPNEHERFQLFSCDSCKATLFERNIWQESLHDTEYEYDEAGNEVVKGGDILDGPSDISYSYPMKLTSPDLALLEDLRPLLNFEQFAFLEQVLKAKSQNMKTLAIIGCRTLFEFIYNNVGSKSARDRFVEKRAKEIDETSQTKNDFKYKLDWLEENGLLTKPQIENLAKEIIRPANRSVHNMEENNSDIDEMMKILHHLMRAFKQSNHAKTSSK